MACTSRRRACSHVDVVGRHDGGAALDAGADIRVDPVAVAREPLAMDRDRTSAGEKPPLALTCAMSSSSAIFSSLKRTPARPSRPIAADQAAATVSSMPSNGMPCQMPSRSPASGTGSSVRRRSPAITASAWAHSLTVFAIGPIESSVNDSGNAPIGRHALLARLPADETAERGRNAGRAAGVGADGDLAHAVRHRHRAARGRAAGHARAVERIARRAEMRIGADAGEREFAHVGLGDDHRAGRAQALAPPAHRLRRRRPSSASTREPARVTSPATSKRSLMLTMAPSSGPSDCAGLRPRVGGVGGRARRIGIDRETGARALARRVGDAGQGLFETVAGGGIFHRRHFQELRSC